MSWAATVPTCTGSTTLLPIWWAAGAPVPRGVAGAAAAGWCGCIYLAGGTPNFDPGGASDEVNVDDIATDTWTGMASSTPVASYIAGVRRGGSVPVPRRRMERVWWLRLERDRESAIRPDQRHLDVCLDLATGRADFALAATNTALYAMGGDTSGGTIFEPTDTVERLETAGWPAGSWSGYAPLPAARTANSAGYCSEGFDGGEVWSVAGANADIFITDRSFVTLTPGWTCQLSVRTFPGCRLTRPRGSVAADGSVAVAVTIDASGLVVGAYAATLLVATTDPALPEVAVPVHVVVEPAKAFISVGVAGAVGGVAVTDEDVVAIAADDTGVLYFDGSDGRTRWAGHRRLRDAR